MSEIEPAQVRPAAEAFTAPGRSPLAAAVAGLVFSVILIATLVLLHLALGEFGVSTAWAEQPGRRRMVVLAVTLIPFAGISFLWFIGVIRTRLGGVEDKLFATVFLGSGLLFVAMLFAGAASLASLLTMLDRGAPVESDTVVALQVLTRELTGAFGARMAAVFMISGSSAGLRGKILPRWLVGLGYLFGLVLLLTPPLPKWGQLVFPTWVLLTSLAIISHTRRTPAS